MPLLHVIIQAVRVNKAFKISIKFSGICEYNCDEKM